MIRWVDDVRDAWRWGSVRFGAALTAGYIAWDQVPPEVRTYLRDYIPESWNLPIAVGLAVLFFITRMTTTEPPKDDPRPDEWDVR